MCADIYTKGLADRTKWQSACDMINIVDPARLRALVVPDKAVAALPSSLVGGVGIHR